MMLRISSPFYLNQRKSHYSHRATIHIRASDGALLLQPTINTEHPPSYLHTTKKLEIRLV